MKRRAVMLLVFGLVSAPLIVGIWTFIRPMYRARAEIRMRPNIWRPAYANAPENRESTPFYDCFVKSPICVMRSPTILQEVLKRQEVQMTQWYRSPWPSLCERLRGKRRTPMDRLQAGLSAQRRRKTDIIDIFFTDINAEDAKVVLDAVVGQYLDFTREASDPLASEPMRQLMEEQKSLLSEIEQSQRRYGQLRNELGTSPRELISAQRLRLDEAKVRLNELGSNISLMEREISGIRTGDSNDVAAAERDKQRRYHQDGEWRKLNLDVETIQYRIASLVADMDDAERVRWATSLKIAEGLRERREAEIDAQWGGRLPDAGEEAGGSVGVRGLFQTTAVLEYKLARAREAERLGLADQERGTKELEEISEAAPLLEKEEQVLQQKYERFDAIRLRVAQLYPGYGWGPPVFVELLTAAQTPTEPQDPRILLTVMAMIPGLCAASVAGFLLRRKKAPENKFLST